MQFAAVASHDLQEPLRTIGSYSALVQRRYQGRLDENADEFLRMIVDASRRMSTLISDLLAFSELTGHQHQMASVMLDDDLETAVSLLQTAIEEAGAKVVHDPLPKVEVYRNQMVRLFQNLLSNSIKFRQPGIAPLIHISAERQNNEWIIRVQDNGIGFDGEHAGLAFQPFKRLHGAEFPGSGIGLAACKRIVESFGGRIGAESEPGQGATFWFTIPVRTSELKHFETDA
jgi:light-regulated signal transduction histidine kinase (bacteriophytochrome)